MFAFTYSFERDCLLNLCICERALLKMQLSAPAGGFDKPPSLLSGVPQSHTALGNKWAMQSAQDSGAKAQSTQQLTTCKIHKSLKNERRETEAVLPSQSAQSSGQEHSTLEEVQHTQHQCLDHTHTRYLDRLTLTL